MTAALGRLLILGSLLVSTTGAMLGYAAGKKRSPEGLKWTQRFAYLFSSMMVLATGVMEWALLTHNLMEELEKLMKTTEGMDKS